MPLYKYLPPDANIVIGNLKLRFTRPSGFNDPFELKPYIEAIATEEEISQKFYEKFSFADAVDRAYDELPTPIKAKMPKVAFVEFMQSQMLEKKSEIEASIQGSLNAFFAELPKYAGQFRDALNKHLERVGILSLTTDAESIYMWTHYAASHTGYAVEFDESHPYFDRRRSSSDEFYHLREVTYYDNLPTYKSVSELDGSRVLCTKSAQYAQEKEWRMLTPLPPVTSESGIAEELFDFPADAVRSVVFGAKATDEFKATVRQRLAEKPEFSHVVCRQVVADHALGRLVIRDT